MSSLSECKISLLEFNTRPSGVRIIKLPALRFVIKIRDKCSMGDFGGEKNSLRKILPVYKFFFFYLSFKVRLLMILVGKGMLNIIKRHYE